MFTRKPTNFKRGYVSEIDQFLQELNKLPGIKSDSRLDEEQKYKKVFALRDLPQVIPMKYYPGKSFKCKTMKYCLIIGSMDYNYKY